MYCQVLHLNGSGTLLDYGDTEGTTVPPNIYYSTRVLLVLYFLIKLFRLRNPKKNSYDNDPRAQVMGARVTAAWLHRN